MAATPGTPSGPASAPATGTPTAPDDRPGGTALPLLNARTWALSFLLFAVVLAVVGSQFLVEFMSRAS
jgi:hypothetical protein